MAVRSASVEPALAAIWADVLGVDEIDDDFFALGGNSLLATQITTRVADVLGVEVALEALFETPELADYARVVEAAGERARGGRRWLSRGRRHRRDELSWIEHSAWSAQRYVADLKPHVGEAFLLTGPLDVPALERALTELVRRHESLRTAFPVVDHRPRASVASPEPVRVERIAVGRGQGRRREEELRRIVDETWSESFDYRASPPLRIRLVQTGPQSHALLIAAHELLFDGQAFALLVRELSALYAAEVAGEASPLPEPVLQYRDVVREHGPGLAGGSANATPEFWQRALADAPLTLPLPFETGGMPPDGDGRYVRKSAELPKALAQRLRALAQAEAATSFMLYLAALYALLHRATGETSLLVKSPTANRARAEWEQVVGFFSIVLPLRLDLDDDMSFRALLQRTRAMALDSFRNAAYTPEDNAIRAFGGIRGLKGWSVLFRMWDPTTEQPLELPGLRCQPYGDDREAGELVLVVTEHADGRTTVQLSSSAAGFDERWLGDMLRSYERLLGAAATDPDRPLGSLELPIAGEAAARAQDEDEVRFRGFRLNPLMALIERALGQHPSVERAAACWDPAASELVGCIVPRRSAAPEPRDLDAWLMRTIDDWILPARYVTVGEIPLRADGSPDRRALAAIAAATPDDRPTAPQTPAERKLATIWKRVLDRRHVGVRDNFFAAGGNLALGLELIERARTAGIAIDAQELLFRPTIAEMAEAAEGSPARMSEPA